MFYFTYYFSFSAFFLLFFFFFILLSVCLPPLSKVRHPNPRIEPYFENVGINRFLGIQTQILGLSLPLAILSIGMATQPVFQAFNVTGYRSFVLLFFSAMLVFFLFFLLLRVELSSSHFHQQLRRFIDSPEPHNPILGAFFRSLPYETSAAFKPLQQERFLSDFFQLFDKNPQPFSSNLFPSIMAFSALSECVAYFLVAINLTCFYISLFFFSQKGIVL